MKHRFLIAAAMALALFFAGATWIYFDPTPAAYVVASSSFAISGKALLVGILIGLAGGWYFHRRWVAWVVRQDPTNWSNDPRYWEGRSAPEL